MALKWGGSAFFFEKAPCRAAFFCHKSPLHVEGGFYMSKIVYNISMLFFKENLFLKCWGKRRNDLDIEIEFQLHISQRDSPIPALTASAGPT